MQSSQEFVNLDSDEEKDAGEGRIQGLIKELSLLKIEVKKWKGEVDIYHKGMIPLDQHKKTIKELRGKWAEELIYQRCHWEEVNKELNKFKSMQKEKDQLYSLSRELMSFRAPSPSYPVFLYEQFSWFKLKELKEGRPYEVASSTQFLETFMKIVFTK